MSKFNTGGPAFPNKLENTNCDDLSGFEGETIQPGVTNTYSGMTLRDYFAAKAMHICFKQLKEQYERESLHTEFFTDEVNDDMEAIALSSYLLADAMLKAREQN